MLVLFNHLNVPFFDSGYVGVDIFFVISGFVITRILLGELEQTKTLKILHFYSKRFRRLIPNLSFMIFSTTLFAFFLSSPLGPQQETAQSALSSLLGLSNFYFMITGTEYFNSLALNPLIHTWSLAVEIQFYLIYPLILRWIFHKYGNRYISKIIMLLFLASIAYNSIIINTLSPSIQDMNFYDPMSRTWEFLLGGFIAASNKLIRFDTHKTYLAGLLFLILPLTPLIPNSDPGDQLLIRFLACLGAALVIVSKNSGDKSKLLTNKVITNTGNMSYSIYLWHYPIIIFSKQLIHNVQISSALSLILLCFFSYATYRYIELPFHRGEFKNAKLSVILPTFIMLPTVAALILGFSAKLIFYPKFEQSQRYLFFGQVGNTHKPKDEATNFAQCKFSGLQISCPGIDKTKGTFFVIGDSHAGALVGTISTYFNSQVAYFNTKSLTDERFQNDLIRLQRHLLAYDQIHIILISNWDRLGVSSRIGDFLQFLESNSVNTYVLEDNPNFKFDAFNCAYGQSIFLRNSTCSGKISIDSKLKSELIKFQNISYIHTKKYFCSNETCSMVSKNNILYFDSHHLNLNGARFLLDKISEEVLSLK